MTIFITTFVCTIVLFVGAALLFNFSKQRSARSRPSGAAGCHQSGLGCSCSSAVQTTISRL
ncbi:MAG: hypothetical protein HKP44_11680 [Desulfofustis sp.]|nr:hypothetical protein [Desulfofustis sp.]NNK57958.1 hypothetical protein [Desulfofustis sp.]